MKSQPQSQRSIRLAQPCGDLHCERVLQFDQFTDAFRITHASYSERGFILPNATGLWMNRHHLLSSTRVFAVSSATQGKGTLTLAEDGPLGLPMETQFRREVVQRRRQFGSIAEATCLALDKRGSTAGPEIVNRLMGAVAQAARSSGVNQIVITVHPRHAPYYTRMAGFRPIGQPRPYLAVRGHLAVPLALHLRTLSTVCPAGYDRYFGMSFPSSVLLDRPTPAATIQDLAKIWKSIQCDPRDTIQETLVEHARIDRRAA